MSNKKIQLSQLLITPMVSVTNPTGKSLEKVVMANKLQVGVNHESFRQGMELHGGVLLFPDAEPVDTTNRLYNENGTLKFNGEEIKGGGGAGGNAGWLSGSQIIYTTGSLGIGTANPDDPVHIKESQASTGVTNSVLRLEHYSSDGFADGDGPGIKFTGGDAAAANNTIGQIAVARDGSDTEGKIEFSAGTNGAETFMTIKSTGNVGVGSTGPKTGFVDVQDYDSVVWTTQLSAAEGGGHILKYGTGTLVAGKIYFLHTDGGWLPAFADDPIHGAYQILGVALGTSPSSDGLLLKGYVRIESSLITGTPQIGYPVYLSDDDVGQYDFTRPTAPGEFVRISGYCLATSGGDILLYFNPDPTWVEIS